jgi:uncharacterized OB-fold protein
MAEEETRSAPVQRRVFPPAVTPETEKFWDAATAGKFLYGFCNACRQPHYYPRAFCPFCFSDRVEWKEASGRALIYSYSIMRRSPTGPYAIAYVTLAEGPTILTNIVDSDLQAIRIGGRVELVFKPSEGGAPVPFFRLAV